MKQVDTVSLIGARMDSVWQSILRIETILHKRRDMIEDEQAVRDERAKLVREWNDLQAKLSAVRQERDKAARVITDIVQGRKQIARVR